MSQLILKRGFVATEGKQNNVSYQGIEIGAGIRVEDVGQPNIQVSLNT
jgi:hypothetical protein